MAGLVKQAVAFIDSRSAAELDEPLGFSEHLAQIRSWLTGSGALHPA
ncbi:hypothetical protein [Actinopolymorpha sp. B9G3]